MSTIEYDTLALYKFDKRDAYRTLDRAKTSLADAVAVLHDALNYHALSATAFEAWGERDDVWAQFHRQDADAIRCALVALVGGEDAREVEAQAWERAAREVRGA